MMAHKSHHNPSAVNPNSTENNLFLDELVQDFDISLSGFGCENTNVSLIRDLNQVINTLGDNIVKVEAIDSEENAQDSTDAQVKYFKATPESPQSNDSCGSYTSTDSDKKFGKSMSYTELSTNRVKAESERKTPKRLCFKGLSAEELSPISSVSSSMESNQKFPSNNSDSSQTGVNISSLNEDNSYGYSWRRYSKTDAPSVHTKMRSVQIGQTIKAEPERRLFQYILGAPTASGVKLGAMTMTYLNQGQPYEIRLKKVSDIPNNDGKNLKTGIRLGFVEKRLQYRESEEMANWCKLHSKDRILDVDFALSYGIFDVQTNSSKSNCLEFVWNPNREASIFVKLNCISTEFTSKRHGGERGTPLRLVIETYSTAVPQTPKLDSAQCLVKVFKSKGADRKHKTDRERIAKQPDSSLYYQPSYDCTLFTTFNDDDILVRTSSPTNIDSPSPSPNTCSSYAPIDSPRPSVQLNIATSSTTCYPSPQSTNPSEEPITPSMAVTSGLPSDATPAQTFEWLNRNRFNKLTDVLMNFSSEDLRRLSREDLIQICRLSDGIRLYNCIHAIQSTTRLTIFVTTDGKVHNAIYLKALTNDELRDRLIEALGITCITIKNFYLIGPNDIKIKVTNNVVLNMKNESIYSLTLDKGEDDYDLVLQSAPF